MPQLWLTYQELGDELGCAPAEARQTAIGQSWTRKHSSDGNTRVLMPLDLMRRYFAAHAQSDLRAFRPRVVEASYGGLRAAG